MLIYLILRKGLDMKLRQKISDKGFEEDSKATTKSLGHPVRRGIKKRKRQLNKSAKKEESLIHFYDFKEKF